MSHPIGLQFLNFEDSEELMLAGLEEGITFTLIELLKVEDILIERHSLLHVIHFNGHMIASVHLNPHNISVFFSSRILGSGGRPRDKNSFTPGALTSHVSQFRRRREPSELQSRIG